MNWFSQLRFDNQEKLKRDSLYFSMVKNGFSYEEILKSGWLDTHYNAEENEMNWKVYSSNLPSPCFEDNKKELCILLNTGSYAPAHNGHIEMMIQAKKEVESHGYAVDGIILSPSHDSYVLKKSEDIKVWNIENRLKALQDRIEDYPYENESLKDLFSIDLWESVFTNCPVNFTDVMFKLEKNIESYLHKKVKIFYVFGSDNQVFVDCFKYLEQKDKEKYFAVCVERKGSPISISEAENIFISKNEKYSNEQSRLIRKETVFKPVLNDKKEGIYCIRLDKDYALQQWINSFPKHQKQLQDSYVEFHKELKDIVEKNIGLETITVDAQEQKELLTLIKNKKANILNLDACTNGGVGQVSLNSSRMFKACDVQFKPIKMVSRYQSESNISLGEYILVDDDIASGQTVEMIKKMLAPKGVKIVEEISLLDSWLASKNINQIVFDIVDTRDFLLGANGSGLMCQMNDSQMRLPYFSPWVNLNKRAKIDFFKQKIFMLEVLKASKKFFLKNNFIQFGNLESDFSKFLQLNNPAKNIIDWIDNHMIFIEKNMV